MSSRLKKVKYFAANVNVYLIAIHNETAMTKLEQDYSDLYKNTPQAR